MSIDTVLAGLEKDFGEGVLQTGKEYIDSDRQVIPISPCLDVILGGGIEEGSFLGLNGPPKLGKTITALDFAATCQMPEYGSRPVFYGNAEMRLSREHLDGISRLLRGKGEFHIIGSSEKKIMTMEDHLNAYTKILKEIPKAVLIIDSISIFRTDKEHTDGVGTETRGGAAKTFSQFVGLIAPYVVVNKAIVIGITQVYANTSGYGKAVFEKASHAWKHQVDYKLRLIMKQTWADDNRVKGQMAYWECETSKNTGGGGGLKIKSFFRFGHGIDQIMELVYLANEGGLIKKAGSWYTLEIGNETIKCQGMEKLCQALTEKPQLVDLLRKAVGELTGLGVLKIED
jgi:recombination protein RecA